MIKLVTENWSLKVLSLAFAIFLWFFIMGESQLEVGYTVPLEMQKLPPDLVIANQVPSLVDVRITGPRALLMKISPTDIAIAVDLSDLKPGLTSFKRLEERLSLPSGLRVTRLSPSFIDIRIERRQDKLVPIKIVLADDPDPGYRIAGISASPPKVKVSGAESEIIAISEVMTEPVVLKGVTESFSQIVPLVYERTYTDFVDMRTAEIHIEIEAEPIVEVLPEPPAAESAPLEPIRKQGESQ
ncbi:MAG: YbbR-like domain-containing protein [Deltaproteobacteria bacterium]|nr:YbbR-like domain-containing protein [Deltaproteobacteria bacterium]NCP01875.1 YbbR-like domain-containing protein [Deltaproteobacteria bacterium]NCP78500.1 YbbR-like domain-containing protein [Desulfuromonadales bacterium]